MTVIEGVDYSTSVPSPAALKAAGKHFACRYGGPGSSGKQLTSSELHGLTSAGIAVVANAEGASQGFNSYNAGRSWATSALAHFNALGMPADRPIYFSADWPVTSADWPDVADALRGAASVLGTFRVGLYGGRYAIQQARTTGLAPWRWQTYAWSTVNGKLVWVDGSHLQQYHNDVTIGGAQVDLTRAVQDDYGQWGVDVSLTTDDKNYLDGKFAAITAFDDPQADGTPTSKIGRLALTQGIPNGTSIPDVHGAYPRDLAWEVFLDLGKELVAARKDIAALKAQVDALQPGTVVVPPEQLQAALVAALEELAARPA